MHYDVTMEAALVLFSFIMYFLETDYHRPIHLLYGYFIYIYMRNMSILYFIDAYISIKYKTLMFRPSC